MTQEEEFVPVETDYSMVWIGSADPGTSDVKDTPIGGLIWPATEQSGVYMLTGTYVGPVAVRARLHEVPPDLASEEWEDISTAVFTPTGGVLHILPILGGDLIALSVNATGRHTVRCAARGRDEALGFPREQYLIDIWPSRPEDGDAGLKATSRRAQENILTVNDDP